MMCMCVPEVDCRIDFQQLTAHAGSGNIFNVKLKSLTLNMVLPTLSFCHLRVLGLWHSLLVLCFPPFRWQDACVYSSWLLALFTLLPCHLQHTVKVLSRSKKFLLPNQWCHSAWIQEQGTSFRERWDFWTLKNGIRWLTSIMVCYKQEFSTTFSISMKSHTYPPNVYKLAWNENEPIKISELMESNQWKGLPAMKNEKHKAFYKKPSP